MHAHWLDFVCFPKSRKFISDPFTSFTSHSSEEKCCDIIEFAAAEMRDVGEGFYSTMPCPVLSALALVDRKKSVPEHQ